jgi:mono/diheme cytochrome c family protein
MTRILSALLASLTLLLVALPTPAEDPRPQEMVENFVTELGYTYHNGLWWKGNQSYTRAKVYYTAYRAYGCCGQTQAYTDWYTQYTPYTAPASVTTNIKYGNNWKTEALQTLAKRDDLVAFENTFSQLNGSSLQGTGGIYAGANYGGYSLTGTTLYQRGNFNALSAALYNTTDVNLLNQASARLITNAQQYTAQAHADHQAIVSQINDGAHQVAVIQALGAASQPQPAVQQTQFQFAPTPPAQVMPQATDPPAQAGPPSPAAAQQAMTAFWTKNCASCHTGATAQKGFTFDTYKGLSRQAKIDKVWARLVSDDPKQLMPRDDKGVGHRLSDAELQAPYNDIASMPVGGK